MVRYQYLHYVGRLLRSFHRLLILTDLQGSTRIQDCQLGLSLIQRLFVDELGDRGRRFGISLRVGPDPFLSVENLVMCGPPNFRLWEIINFGVCNHL